MSRVLASRSDLTWPHSVGLARSDQAEPGQTCSGQDSVSRSAWVMPGLTGSGLNQPGHVNPGHLLAGQAGLGQAGSDHVRTISCTSSIGSTSLHIRFRPTSIGTSTNTTEFRFAGGVTTRNNFMRSRLADSLPGWPKAQDRQKKQRRPARERPFDILLSRSSLAEFAPFGSDPSHFNVGAMESALTDSAGCRCGCAGERVEQQPPALALTDGAAPTGGRGLMVQQRHVCWTQSHICHRWHKSRFDVRVDGGCSGSTRAFLGRCHSRGHRA